MQVILYISYASVDLAQQVKRIRAEHGKKSFGPVLVDQLYGYALCNSSLLMLVYAFI